MYDDRKRKILLSSIPNKAEPIAKWPLLLTGRYSVNPVRYPVSRPQTNSFCYFFIFAILQDSKNHHHETNNRNHRSYHDTAGAEYIGIERIIPGTSTTHQYETKHDAGNRYRNQYKILFSKAKSLLAIFLNSLLFVH